MLCHQLCLVVLGEGFEATATSTKTGRTVHQLFFARLVAENGKIKLFREALNTLEVAKANVQNSADLF